MKDRWNSWKGLLAALPVAGAIAAVVVLLFWQSVGEARLRNYPRNGER
jgi:hypothetical protein